jgi:hypothetical protein
VLAAIAGGVVAALAPMKPREPVMRDRLIAE